MKSKPSKNACILIAEDETNQRELLSYILSQGGFDTLRAKDGAEALALALSQKPDLIMLDWMMPEVSGIDVCQKLRADAATKHIPIIMVSARGEESDRSLGLETGADDYITKPFSPRELVARVHAVLRRARPELVSAVLEFADIKIYLEQKRVEKGGVAIKLGAKEFGILCVLLGRPDQVFSRQQLLAQVWGAGLYVDERTVDVHVSRLRKALGGTAKSSDGMIRNVRNLGYTITGGE